MPITAKLSREFYERFGNKVVNEMVDLFNSIDEASRSDLERLNEANALRFEARALGGQLYFADANITYSSI